MSLPVYEHPIARVPLRRLPEFRSLGQRLYRWPRVMHADEWTGMLATFSDHAVLGPGQLLDLQSELRGVIDRQAA